MKQNRLLPVYLWGSLFVVVLLISGMANLTLAEPELNVLELLREANPTTGANIIWPILLVLGFPLVLIFAIIFFPLLKSRNTILGLVIVLAVILFFMWSTAQTRTVDQELLAPTAVPVATAPPEIIPEDPLEPELPPAEPLPLVPPWISTLITITFLLLLVGGTALVIWFFWPREPLSAFPMRELSQDAEDALSDLRSGVNLRNVILRCYVEMGRTVDEWRGVQRTQDMTPREFESSLTAIGLPQKPVADLTRLFETVRYGTNAPSKEEEETAESSLTAIIQACQELAA